MAMMDGNWPGIGSRACGAYTGSGPHPGADVGRGRRAMTRRRCSAQPLETVSRFGPSGLRHRLRLKSTTTGAAYRI